MLSQRPTLSVIILAYNEEKYIGRCLDSLKNQTTPPDEVIVVGNNSTDRTEEIARSYPFVTFINEKEQGMIPARDTGFNTAKGDLLARIDADTRLPHHWVETVHKVLDRYAGHIFGASGPYYFYNFHNRLVRQVTSDVFSKFGFFRVSKLMLGHETLFGSNMVISRLAWQKVKNEVCHDSREVHEDVDLAIHIGKYGEIIYDERLVVGISRRAFVVGGPAKAFWRINTWPRTITKHRPLFMRLN